MLPSQSCEARPGGTRASDSSAGVTTHGESGLDQLVYEQFFPGVTSGIFVDVGTAGPELLSMSAYYRELGWRVIAVEPNPDFCATRRAAGQDVLEYACADYDADGVAFAPFWRRLLRRG